MARCIRGRRRGFPVLPLCVFCFVFFLSLSLSLSLSRVLARDVNRASWSSLQAAYMRHVCRAAGKGGWVAILKAGRLWKIRAC